MLQEHEDELIIDESEVSVASSTSSTSHQQSFPPPSPWRQALLFFTYACTIFCVAAPPALYPAMQRDLADFTSGDAATVLSVATVGTGLGKINAMLTVGRCGARRSYFVTQVLLSLFVFLLSVSSAVWMLALCTFAMELSAGPSWPSHGVIVRGWWPIDRLASAFWVLSLSSRGSDMGSKLLYGGLINAGVGWRWTLRLASVFALLGALASRWHGDTREASDVRTPGADVKRQLSRFRLHSGNKSFWLAGSCMLLLTCVKKSGQLTSVYFRDVTNTTVLSDGGAASMGVVFQSGLVVSVLVGGKVYEHVLRNVDGGRTKVIALCAGLVLMSGVCSVLLALSSVSASAPDPEMGTLVWRGFLVFLVAAGVGLTYYVPMGVFSVEYGKEDTALVSAYLDLLGYLMSAFFMAIVLRPSIDGDGGWGAAWACIACVTFAAAFATVVFLRMLLFGETTVCFCLRGGGGGGGGGGEVVMYQKQIDEEEG